MNIAILIGVSDYDTQLPLPASKRDVELVRRIIDLSDKYDSVLYIADSTNTQDVKARLAGFVSENMEKKVDEVLFYFSGHGHFSGTDFHYIMSDFDQEKIRTTSLENSELDVMIKSLQPELTIKIVDACNSGIAYIKDPNALEKHLQSLEQRFKKCYFMLSSGDDQSSYANSELSFFTKAIGDAVSTNTSDSIRYKDIIDFVSDKFRNDKNQSPIFVTQANYTEVFINADKDARSKINEVIPSVALQNQKNDKKTKNLFELVKDDATRYLSEKEAIEQFMSVLTFFESKESFINDAKGIFDITLSVENEYGLLPLSSKLASWVNKNSDDLFVKVVFEDKQVTRRVPKNRWSSLTSWLDNDEEFKAVTEMQRLPSRIEETTPLPFAYLQVKATSRFPNVTRSDLYIVPLLSKTRMVIFSSVIPYKSVGWDSEKMIDHGSEWFIKSIQLNQRDEIKQYLESLMSLFEKAICTPLKAALGLVENLPTTEKPKELPNIKDKK